MMGIRRSAQPRACRVPAVPVHGIVDVSSLCSMPRAGAFVDCAQGDLGSIRVRDSGRDFNLLGRGASPTQRVATRPRALVPADAGSFIDEVATTHARTAQRSQRVAASHARTTVAASPRQHPLYDAHAAHAAEGPQRVSGVYKRKVRTLGARRHLTHYHARHGTIADFQDDTPLIDFNSPYPYYNTVGTSNRAAYRRERDRSIDPQPMEPLAGQVKRSHHVPQPMDDAPPLANLVVVDDPASLRRSMNTTPYHKSVLHAAYDTQQSQGVVHATSFTSPVGTQSPKVGARDPLLESTQRMRRQASERKGNKALSWANDVGGFTASPNARRMLGTRVDSTDDAARDDSGDEQREVATGQYEYTFKLPVHPEEEERERQEQAALERLGGTSAASVLRGTRSTNKSNTSGGSRAHGSGGLLDSVPWQFHPAMDVPLSLLLQRGVDIYAHQELIEYHMHPELLNDLHVLRAGSTVVKYPRSARGVPHERFVYVDVARVGGGDAAFLVWKVHANAHLPIDRVPLTHLVGVTSDDSSSAFGRFVVDSGAARAKAAKRGGMSPVDTLSSPSSMPHHTIASTGLDSQWAAAVEDGEMLYGPTLEDTRRALVPRRHAMTLWFVDTRTGKCKTIDFATYQLATWVRWINAMRGVIAINSTRVGTMPDAGDDDDRLPEGFGMDGDAGADDDEDDAVDGGEPPHDGNEHTMRGAETTADAMLRGTPSGGASPERRGASVPIGSDLTATRLTSNSRMDERLRFAMAQLEAPTPAAQARDAPHAAATPPRPHMEGGESAPHY